jgi:translation initiation factor 2 beta subunit (eIF-2beta)/eIF-5
MCSIFEMDKTSKRQKIQDLLRRGYPTKDIVIIVKTTPANVWKEKSKMKRAMQNKVGTDLETESKIHPPPKDNSQDNSDTSIENFSNFNGPKMQNNNTGYHSLNFNELYNDFDTEKQLVSIVISRQIHPAVVEKEYERYLRFRDIDSKKIKRNRLLFDLSGKSEVTERVLEKYQRKGYLEVEDFHSLFQSKLYEIASTQDPPPSGWSAVRCKRCQKFQHILIDRTGEAGLCIIEDLEIECCHGCSSKM